MANRRSSQPCSAQALGYFSGSLLLACTLVIWWIWLSGPSHKPVSIAQYSAQYFNLAVQLGQLYPHEIDALFMPVDFAAQKRLEENTLEELIARTGELLQSVRESTAHELYQGQKQQLITHLDLLLLRLQTIQSGSSLTFSEQASKLYGLDQLDSFNPATSKAKQELETLLPGHRTLSYRIADVVQQNLISPDKREQVFNRALAECRARTNNLWPLPSHETVSIHWTGAVAVAWHQYQGNGHSVLLINPQAISTPDHALDIACHEVYPGHHTQFMLLESAYNQNTSALEQGVFFLRSPDAVLRESAASLGTDLLFPGKDRLLFERAILYPMAGLDPALAETNIHVQSLVKQVSFAALPILIQYFDGTLSRADALFLLEQDALISSPGDLLDFTDQYGAFVSGYTLVHDALEKYLIEGVGSFNAADSNSPAGKTSWQLETWSMLEKIILEKSQLSFLNN